MVCIGEKGENISFHNYKIITEEITIISNIILLQIENTKV